MVVLDGPTDLPARREQSHVPPSRVRVGPREGVPVSFSPSRRSRSSLVAVLAAVMLLLATTGCGDEGDEATPSTTAATAAPQDFSGRGPYAAGVTRLALGNGQPVNVFYPADRSAVPTEAAGFVYTPEDSLGPLAAVLPPGLASTVTVPDAWVDLQASRSGPFPLVVISHGRGATRFSQSLHLAHLASWGFVVAAVQHPSRDLQARLARRDVGTSDVSALEEVIALLAGENERAGGPLEGRIATEQIAVEGHSAGGRDAGLAAYDPQVGAWISLFGAPPVPDQATGGRDVVTDGNDGFDPAAGEFDLGVFLSSTAPPPAKPAMIIAADNDVVYPVSDRRAVYDWLQSPKRWVVLANTGHNVYNDTCEGTQRQGGLGAVADALGLSRTSPEIQLSEDGCLPEDAPAGQIQAVWNHLDTAQLRWAFGLDTEVAEASLERTYLDETFPGTIAEYEADG